MKKLTLFFLLLFAARLSAQQIDSMVVTPSAPTTADTVKVYVYLQFPSSGCAAPAVYSMNGYTINASALHCMGMASTLCYDVDTLVFAPPMTPGNYAVYFSLDAGFGPPGNCSPGFVPYDHDTAYFTVASTTGIPYQETSPLISVYPNPATNVLHFANLPAEAGLQLLNPAGEIVLEETVTTTTEVDLSQLPTGMYFWKIVSGKELQSAGKLQVVR